LRRFALTFVLLAVATVGAVPVAEAGGARDYIVRYRESAVAGSEASVRVASGGRRFDVRRVDKSKVDRRVRKAKGWGVKPRHVFRNGIGGFAARLTPDQVRKLRDDPSVASIEVDAPVSIAKDMVEGGVVSRGEFSRQQMPTGIKRIYADRQPLARIGDRTNINVDIAVLDTGIAPHPDLRIGGGYNCSVEDGRDPTKYTDRYGHGTHVAGTIAAKDNGIGVVGVVPGARVWAIKVLGDNGSGKTSDIVCGLQWMVGQQLSAGGPRFIAANMSIAGPQQHPVTACGNGTSDTYHQLICLAMDAGMVFAVAAANDHRVVNQRPAIFDEPITVAALADYDGRPGGNGRQKSVCPWYSSDSDDTWANFSNWGAAVDIVAPGKCILSTFKNRRYAWMSGTSMATPHVTGAIALYRMRYPNALPQQVKQALVSAGTRDWRTGSAPDGRPYRLLQVRSLTTPPTFGISSVTAPSTPLGGEGAERGIRVTLSRRDGHYRQVRISVSQPDSVGSETLRIAERSRAGTLRLQGTSALQTGTVPVTVRATDGELSATRTVRIPVDADPPRVDIVSPTGGLIIQGSDRRNIRATSSDAYTGIARRTLQRRRAVQTGPMSCDDVTWTNDGSARTVSGSGPWTSSGLRSGYCYRWNVTAYDKAGNATVERTAIVWTDVSSPESPDLTVTGDAVARGTTVWYRKGTSGRFTLQALSRDPHSGVSEAVIGSVGGSGWSTTSSSTVVTQGVTATASRGFAFGSGSDASSVTVRATNRVDRSRRTTVAFKPDGNAPSIRVTAPSKLTWLGSPSTRVRYDASDSGAGVGTVTARRQRTDLRSKSEGCASSWSADGAQGSVGSSSFSVDDLERGYCYRWVITVTDRVGHSRSRTTSPVAIDPTKPVVGDVKVVLDRGTVRTTGSIPVRVTWRLRTSPVGSTSYSLARTTDGGSTWNAVDHPRGTSRSQDTTLADGRATTLSVRGRASTGISSDWAVSRRMSARLVQENASSVTTSSGWRRVSWDSASGGYRLSSSKKGSKVIYRFDGGQIGLVAARASNLGTAIIRIDGKVAATLNLHRTPSAVREVVWTRSLSSGPHTISVQVRSGTVVVDGFVVTRSATGDRR
jgi:subtilisin family serine protease